MWIEGASFGAGAMLLVVAILMKQHSLERGKDRKAFLSAIQLARAGRLEEVLRAQVERKCNGKGQMRGGGRGAREGNGSGTQAGSEAHALSGSSVSSFEGQINPVAGGM